MLKIEVIGNLGADGEKRNVDGNSFIALRVCHSRKIVNQSTGEVTEECVWLSCTWPGDGGKVLQFLKKGQKVFIRGNGALRTYKSNKDGMIHAGLNVRVSEIELCGFKNEDQQKNEVQQNPEYPF